MTDKMERMDEQIKHGISLGISTCEIMVIVIDKTFFVKTFFQKLDSWCIAFLQTDHSNRRMITLLKVDKCFQFSQGLTGWFLDEKRFATLQHLRSNIEMG